VAIIVWVGAVVLPESTGLAALDPPQLDRTRIAAADSAKALEFRTRTDPSTLTSFDPPADI
jgi:hypothetical protein